MKRSGASQTKAGRAEERLFFGSCIADSMVRSAFGDHQASLSRLKLALALKPDYAPAILSMGSVEYRRATRPGLFSSSLARTKMAWSSAGRLSSDSPPPLPYIRASHAAPVTRVPTTKRWQRPSGHCGLSRTIGSWSTTSVGVSLRQAASKRPSKCSNRRSPRTPPMSWRERTCASVRRQPRSRARKPAARERGGQHTN